MMRDQIVIGVYKEDTRRRLLANSTLILQKAVDALLIDDRVEKDVSYFWNLHNQQHTMSINKQQQKSNWKVKKYRDNIDHKTRKCYQCGKTHEDFKNGLETHFN